MKEKGACKLIMNIFMILLLLVGCGKHAQTIKDYPISPVPFTNVRITDDFWSERILTNHRITIPIAFKMAEQTGRIDNFRIAGGLKTGKFSSLYPFDDSDVYKNIEAAGYSLQLFPDTALESYLDTLIGYITAAQEADGYLYTNRTIDPAAVHEMAGKERWMNEELHSHELYNAGHLYEAAVAHFQATGKKSLLDVALKNASLVNDCFGWGKIEKAPGHQEIEIGLVKLYRLTGEKKYLDLAKFFLDVRGPGKDSYNQMHEKPYDQKSAVGHAVRAQYMYSAMADIAALTGDSRYLAAIDTLWEDVVMSKTYITGGIGAVRDIEGFGQPYHLPNLEAYCETCASIANAFWNYRMFLLHGEAKYYDVFEKVLYNGLLSGVSLSGDQFFYPNPLASDGRYSRKSWFGCACCPVNITRFLPSLPGYIYATGKDNIYINLYIGNEASINLHGNEIKIKMDTDYPRDGKTDIVIETSKPEQFSLMLRIPGWINNQAFVTDLYQFADSSSSRPVLRINGTETSAMLLDGYWKIDRIWKNGDFVTVDFPMEVRKVGSNPLVKENEGLLALQRGPLIYCIETDTAETVPVLSKQWSDYQYREDILNGTGIISCGDFNAIPYYIWANRGISKMAVWLATEE